MSTQQVLTVVGTAIGSYYGYPELGTAVGALAGGALASQQYDVPQVSDLKAPQLHYGAKLMRLYGGNRTSGVLAWYSEKRIIPGSGGSGKGDSVTSDAAEIDVLYILSVDSDVIGFARVWKNGEMVWTQHASSTTASVGASAAATAWTDIRFLDGNPAQLPDPTIEAAEGVGNAPAYRHRQCVLIEGLQLGQSGQLPLIEFECGTSGAVSTVSSSGFYAPLIADGNDTVIPIAVLNTSNPPQTSYSSGGVILTADAGLNAELTWTEPKLSPALSAGMELTYSAWIVSTPINGPPPSDTNQFRFFTHSTGAIEFSFGHQYVSNSLRLQVYIFNGGAITYDLGPAPVAPGEPFPIEYKIVFELGDTHTAFHVDGVVMLRIPASKYGGGVLSVKSVWGGANSVISHRVQDLQMYTGSTAFTSFTFAPGTADLADIVSAEWARVDDVANIDVSQLAGIPVHGFQTSGSVRGALEALSPVFHFGAVCSDKVYFRLQGGASVATIAAGDLAAGEDKAAEESFAPERANDDEIAERAILTYTNYSDDYANGTETANRGIGTSGVTEALQSNVVMIPAEAKAVVETFAAQASVAATTGQIALTDYHAALEPTDPITVPDEEGTLYRMRITRETYGGGIKKLELVRDDITALIAPGVTADDYAQSLEVAIPEDTEILLIDTGILVDADDDAGFYAVAKGSPSGANLYNSLDGVTYTLEVGFSAQSVFGTCLTALNTWAGGRLFDEVSSVTVDVLDGALTSSTRAAMLADCSTNICAIGVDGRWELCQYRTATLVSAGTYVITGFLRGAHGTEWAAAGHAVGEAFVLLTSAARRVSVQNSELGVSQYYKGVSLGLPVSGAAAQRFTDNGLGLKPFAPVNIRVSRATSNDATITFDRRTRLSTRFASSLGMFAPLGEATESYSIDIYSSSAYTTVVRTLPASTPSVGYSAAQQSSDGLTPGATLYMRVYQLSGTVGRGYAAEKAA